MSGSAVGTGAGFTLESEAGRENFFFLDISMILIENRPESTRSPHAPRWKGREWVRRVKVGDEGLKERRIMWQDSK